MVIATNKSIIHILKSVFTNHLDLGGGTEVELIFWGKSEALPLKEELALCNTQAPCFIWLTVLGVYVCVNNLY